MTLFKWWRQKPPSEDVVRRRAIYAIQDVGVRLGRDAAAELAQESADTLKNSGSVWSRIMDDMHWERACPGPQEEWTG